MVFYRHDAKLNHVYEIELRYLYSGLKMFITDINQCTNK